MTILYLILLGVAVIATALLLSAMICAPFLYLHHRWARRRAARSMR
jgi:hypothetical protein